MAHDGHTAVNITSVPHDSGNVVQTKSVSNSNFVTARTNVPDIKVVGNGDLFKVLCKAYSTDEGWMKSTKAMEIPNTGCLIQITTQQRNPDGSYAVAEALQYIPGVRIIEDENNGRKLVPL